MNPGAITGNDQDIKTATEVRMRFLAEFDKELGAWQAQARMSGYEKAQIDFELNRMMHLRDRALANTDARFWIQHRRDSARMICKAVAPQNARSRCAQSQSTAAHCC